MPLSLVEARGFPLYIVSYTSDDGAFLGSVNTTNSSVIITGLNPNIGFSFTVLVATGSGNGPVTTSKLFVHTLPSFHMSHSSACTEQLVSTIPLYPNRILEGHSAISIM